MSFNLTRLSLFAYISAIEDDLRNLADGLMGEHPAPIQVLGEHLYTTCAQRHLKAEGTPGRALRVSDLLPYIDFGDGFALLNRHHALVPDELAFELSSKTSALEKLIPIRNKVCHGRPIEHEETIYVFDLCDELRRQTQFPWQRLRKTHEKLKDNPFLALEYTIPSPRERIDKVLHNLPQPDFDETGYVGRRRQIDELKALCLGTYPVTTVVAEGGTGKTATLLKVAYDLLDSKDCPFDAIIWSSSRTSQLTTAEVQKIEGAISDSLGMFRDVSLHIGAVGNEDPIEEVVRYLSEFKILLILDNLETVLDDRVRGFLQRLPKGSKVLISSRIGVGAYEYPYKLAALDTKDSLQLLRILIRTRQLRQLEKLPQDLLAQYCDKMGNNPGFIKWFAAVIQAGKRPEEVLANPIVFLQFCLSNVYEYLSPDSRRLLQVLQVFSRSLNQAEISYLSALSSDATQRAIQQLLTTNMIIMTSSSVSGSGYETQYEMTEMAMKYITKTHPVAVETYKEMRRRQQNIADASAEVMRRSQKSRYAMDSIVLRSSRDAIVAKMLLDALALAGSKDFIGAEETLARAKALSADYFEVYKMEALIACLDRKFTAARSAYLTAVEIEPKSAPLRVFYAGFLLRYLQDADAAMEQLQIALSLDPTAHQVKVELARCKLGLQDFSGAEEILLPLAGTSRSAGSEERKIIHLLLQIYNGASEKAETDIDALAGLEKLKRYFEGLSYAMIDEKMRETIRHAKNTIFRVDRRFRKNTGLLNFIERIEELKVWALTEAQEIVGSSRDTENNSDMGGTIVRLVRNREFGFIQGEDNEQYFFYLNYVVSGYERITEGSLVRFKVGSNRSGPCAVYVTVV